MARKAESSAFVAFPATEPVTIEEQDLCEQPVETGRCRARFPRWFYNKDSGMCETFTYGGCGGNKNNFPTQQDCENRCKGKDVHKNSHVHFGRPRSLSEDNTVKSCTDLLHNRMNLSEVVVYFCFKGRPCVREDSHAPCARSRSAGTSRVGCFRRRSAASTRALANPVLSTSSPAERSTVRSVRIFSLIDH